MNVCPVFVGRDAELDRLRAALSGGGVVLIAGEAGIGKTRLLKELADLALEQGRAVVWARPEVVTTPGPYSLVADLVEDIHVSGSVEDTRELSRLLSTGGPEVSELPARQVAALVRGALSSLGAPVVMLEDLHAADELSQAVLAHLARSSPDDGSLLAATYRSEESGGIARLLDLLTKDRLASHLELRPLPRDEIAEMLGAMWGRPPSEDEIVAMQQLAEGVPFFVEELAAAPPAASGQIPASIARAVQARLAALGAEARSVVQAASLSTGALDPAVLAHATGIPEQDIPRHLVDAARAGLLADREGRLVFRHALVRDAIAGAIVSVEAARLHGLLATAIERFHQPDLEPHARALARHHRAAGSATRAAEYAVLDGRRALAAGAIEEARAAFAAAAADDPDGVAAVHVLAGQAEVSLRSGDSDAAVHALRRAADRYRAQGLPLDAARALMRLAWIRSSAWDRDALDALDEALALLESTPEEPTYARAVIEKGYTLTRVFGEAEAGRPLLERGLTLAERLDDLVLRAEAYEGLSWVAEFLGEREDAERYGELACGLALEAGREELIGKTHTNHTLRLATYGRCALALARLDAARDRLVRGTGAFLVPRMDQARAWVLWRMGMPEEADRYARRLDATRFGGQYVRVIRAWAAAEQGDVPGARAIVSAWWDELGGPEVRARAIQDPDSAPDPSSLVCLSELLVAAVSDDAPTPEVMEMALGYREVCRAAVPDIEMMAVALLARLLAGAARAEEATETLRSFEKDFAGREYPLHQAAVHDVRGLLASQAGDQAAAAGWFARAAETYGRAENRGDRARALRSVAAAELAAGAAREDVVGTLRAARDLAAEAGAIAEVNRIEAALRDLGIRPRAGRPKGSGRPERALSAREEEVVALVAAGASNAEIGARLFLSPKTVESHITNAGRRLGVSGRAGLAAWAAKNGLV